jgi:FMN phosphatase YigB (HAD superfamily)
MSRYTTVLFDMFDTLVSLDRRRLPRVRIKGREVASSVGRVFPAAAPGLPGVSVDAFYDAFVASYRDAEEHRGPDHREVPAFERFGFCYTRLGVDPASVPRAFTEGLIEIHSQCLAAVADPLPGRPALLDWVKDRYRVGLVSNFDYAPTVVRILEADGILDRFEVVLVSDRVGWRKPSARIFEAACARLGVTAGECLFVGDRPDIDVSGAKQVGMAAAWLNPSAAPLPEGLPAPDFTLSGLGELRGVLETAGWPASGRRDAKIP